MQNLAPTRAPSPTMTTPAVPIVPERRRIEDATCLSCGLLCDDIVLTVAGGQIEELENACERGRSWFLLDRGSPQVPEATIDGREVSRESAINRMVAILNEARAPVLSGLSGTTTEAQALATSIADRLGAVISPSHADSAWPRVSAIQRSGAVVASFGEVANRADVIILWNVDADVSFPRLKERMIDRPGRFVPEGRKGRTVLVVDTGDSSSRSWADEAIAVQEGCHTESLRAIRAAVRGIKVDADRIEQATGNTMKSWQRWAEHLKGARYGAILFDEQLAREGSSAIEALMRLLDDLNQTSRCVAVPLAGPGNPSGAEAILTSRFGGPIAIDLSDGAPRYRPDDADPEPRLRTGECDVYLLLGTPIEDSSENSPEGVAVLRIGPDATKRSGPGIVAINTSTPGIDSGGTVVRCDEVPLPLRPPLTSSLPADQEVLALILGLLVPSECPESD